MRENLNGERAMAACPRCGSADVAWILRGYPAFSQELDADLLAGRVILGGCLVWDEQSDHLCKACGIPFREDGRAVAPDPDFRESAADR